MEGATALQARLVVEAPQLLAVAARVERQALQAVWEPRQLAERHPQSGKDERRCDGADDSDHGENALAAARKAVAQDRVDEHRGRHRGRDRDTEDPSPCRFDDGGEAGEAATAGAPCRLDARHAISAWMRPLASFRPPPSRPARTAMISASIDSAVSAGVWAPMSRPA